MNKFLPVLILLIFMISCRPAPIPELGNQEKLKKIQEEPLTKIAFGSCNKQYEEQPMWAFIESNKPQLWIWLGDNIYGDTEDMRKLRSEYILQKENSNYRSFASKIPVIGIWDDHDYGENNAGKEFGPKAKSRDLMFEFLEVDKKNPAWKREGAYQSYQFGPPGQQVNVILLDSRYFRDAPIRDEQGYIPNEYGDVLGEQQWKWLEEELKTSSAQVHIVANGTQFIAEDHAYEKWSNFPKSRDRLLKLFEKYKPKNLLLLSGDRHIAEYSRINLDDYPHDIYDITSSGLTHSYDSLQEEENQHRVGKLVTRLNFGILKLDWTEETVDISMEIRGLENKLLLGRRVRYQL